MKLSIIIPCYNEERTIKKLVEKVIKFSLYEKEIIIIDDCSTDNSREIITTLAKDNSIIKYIFFEKNVGKGGALKKGFDTAIGDIILIQDADLEYNPKEYYKLIRPILDGNADVVYGSRFIGGDERRILFFWHTVANKVLTLLSNMFTNLNLTDMETCYKVFTKELIKKVDLREKGSGFDPEVTAKIAKLKPKIYEVGISYFGRTYDEGKKIGFKDAFVVLKCIFIYNLF